MSETHENIEEIKKKIEIGPAWLTRFERARVIGARALQITMGAPVLIDTSKLPRHVREDPVLLAKAEFEAGILPITIVRYTRGGRVQPIPLKWLLVLDKLRVH
jgi:DNA-directed RNA polymerase subunit K/omega